LRRSKPPPQIGHARHNPDARSCGQSDHFAKLSSTARKAITSTDPTVRRIPFRNWISIVPGDKVRTFLFTDSAGFMGLSALVKFWRASALTCI